MKSIKYSILLIVIIMFLIIILSSVYVIKELLYPTYSTCEEAETEYLRMKKSPLPGFAYKDKTEQYNKLCK